MPVSELQELELRERLDAGGLSELEELNIRETIDGGEAPQEEPGFFESAGREILGGLETGRAIIQPVVGETLAGIGGLARTITAGPEEGEKTITQIKEAFEFDLSTEEAKRNIKAAGKILKPVGEILQAGRDFLGDTVFDATGSPGMATAAFIIPDAILEILGAKGVSTLSRAGKVQKNAGKIRKVIKRLEAENAAKMDKGIMPAAPSVDEIFDSAGILYKEVDKLGATVKPEAISSIIKRMRKTAAESGFDPDLTPSANSILKRFESTFESLKREVIDIEAPPIQKLKRKGQQTFDPETLTPITPIKETLAKKTILDPLSTSGVDRLRRVTQNGTRGFDPKFATDRAISAKFVQIIDNALGDAKNINIPAGVNPLSVSNKLKSARALWSRGKRSEVIGKLMASAELADNPRKALKVKFRNLIDPTKKTSKMFNAAETKAIRDFVKPGVKVNFLRLLGNFGLDLENVTSIQNLFVSAGGGAAAVTTALGPVGTVIALAGGTGSQWLAKKLLQKQSQFADQLIRAGRDAPEIVKTYLKVAKGKNRKASDLTQLLLNATPDSIAGLPKTEFLRRVTEELAATKKRIRESAVSEVVSKARAFEEAVPIPALGLGQQNGEQ